MNDSADKRKGPSNLNSFFRWMRWGEGRHSTGVCIYIALAGSKFPLTGFVWALWNRRSRDFQARFLSLIVKIHFVIGTLFMFRRRGETYSPAHHPRTKSFRHSIANNRIVVGLRPKRFSEIILPRLLSSFMFKLVWRYKLYPRTESPRTELNSNNMSPFHFNSTH